jgi:hypothetical protein
MKIIWDNPEKTYVRVEIMGATYQIPKDDGHPDWRNIKAMVEAGQLVIGDYQPPEPLQD